MTKAKRTIIAIRGDTQVGHSGGLVNPDTQIPDLDIDESGRYIVTGWRRIQPRPIQRKLWDWHEQDRSAIRDLADKDEIVFLEMGDLTQGGIFKDDLDQIGLNEQVTMSRWICTPWLDIPNVKRMYIAKGTGVHLWGMGATETLLTAQLNSLYPKKKVKISDHWMLNMDGFRMDVAHHGNGVGIRNWTRGNVFDLYLKSILMDDINVSDYIPNVVLRAHYHEFVYRRAIHQVKDKLWELPGFVTPPYCFIGDHATKVCKSPAFMGVGMMALEIINGKLYDWHRFTHYVDLRIEEKL